MRKTKVKRVALVGMDGERLYFPDEYSRTLPDWAILSALYEVGKNYWVGKDLILPHANGFYKYEVYTVTYR